jgi:hypothetical protein
VSTIPAAEDVLDPDEAVYDLPTVASLLDLPVTKVHQRLRERHLIAVRRDGTTVVPKAFFDDAGHVVKSLPGLLVVLHDGGYNPTEIVRWLDGGAAPQPNGRPVDALSSHQAREVVRRAQAMGY